MERTDVLEVKRERNVSNVNITSILTDCKCQYLEDRTDRFYLHSGPQDAFATFLMIEPFGLMALGHSVAFPGCLGRASPDAPKDV